MVRTFSSLLNSGLSYKKECPGWITCANDYHLGLERMFVSKMVNELMASLASNEFAEDIFNAAMH